MKSPITGIAILCLIAISFSNCTNQERIKRIARIDSLENIITATSEIFDSIDWEIIENQSIITRENIDYIHRYYTDTMSKEEAEILTNYYNANKGYAKLMALKIQNAEEIKYSKEQLENLKTDVNNGLIDIKKYRKYINTESKAVNQLNITIRNIEKVHSKIDPLFDSSSSTVNLLVSKLRQEQIEQQKEE